MEAGIVLDDWKVSYYETFLSQEGWKYTIFPGPTKDTRLIKVYHAPEQFEKLSPNEKRFGYIAIEKRFINTDQLVEAFDIQITEENKNRKHLFIGEILLDLNYMTLEQIEEVLVVLTKKGKTK